jgi:acyl carrier protein
MSDVLTMSHSVSEIEAKIAEFLAAQSIEVPKGERVGDVPLLAGDALDSLGIVQLTMFLADAFEVEVEDEDFVPENFATVGSLAEFVHAKLEARG